MAAPAVATPATRASTTWSVYGRVAQTPHERPKPSPGTQGLMHCLWMIARHTPHMSLSVPAENHERCMSTAGQGASCWCARARSVKATARQPCWPSLAGAPEAMLMVDT